MFLNSRQSFFIVPMWLVVRLAVAQILLAG
nr:MAG TPA: hypothetical protein [Caudoviricetes sp.]